MTPHSFIDATTLKTRLKRSTTAESDVDQRCIDAVNAATHWMETKTGRKLKARNYRLANTLSAFNAIGGLSNLAVVTATLHAGDDLVGTNIDVGSQILSVNSASQVTLNKSTLDAINGPVTFGSRPLVVDVDSDPDLRLSYGAGAVQLWLPERPLVQVFGLYWLDTDGTRTALSTTGARYEYETGRIVLTNDVFPAGNLKVSCDVRCGYTQPTSLDLGHDQWYQLEQIALRVAEIFYTDALQIRGRATDVGTASANAHLNDTVPADVMDMLLPFMRRW